MQKNIIYWVFKNVQMFQKKMQNSKTKVAGSS